MNAEIVSIGTELLLGEITDTNATWLARQLREIGVNLFYVTAVGDNEGRIIETLRHSLERSDLVITTGGLGPTVDDMTRQAVAAATGRELEFHQALLDQIAARFEQFGVAMTENNRQQAYVPQGAIIVENPVGTAPCFIVESEQGIIISLPGVPREMKYLMENSVLPYIKKAAGVPAVIKPRVLHTAGIGESYLDEYITDFMKLNNPTVGLAAHSGQTDIRITARAESEAEADAMIAEVEAQIRAKVGKFIYGVDKDNNLPEVLAQRLAQKGLKLLICEVGTGLEGIFSQYLSRLSDPSVLADIEKYDELAEIGIYTPSLKDAAEQILAERLQPDWVGLAVVVDGSGAAGLAIHTPNKNQTREIRLPNGENIIPWATQWGLGYIWRNIGEG